MLCNKLTAALFGFSVLLGAMPPFPGVAAEWQRIEDFRTYVSPPEEAAARNGNARSLATQAYLWGLPAFLNYRQATELKQGRSLAAPHMEPFGGWVLMRKLATPDDRANVMPNVDTLYGAAYVLLDKQGPVVLSVPEVKGRYYSVALHDAYFNTFAVVGTRTTDGKAANVLIVPPGYGPDVPGGFDRVITAPTPVVALYQRIFTRDEADVPAVHAIQDQIRLAPLAKWQQSDAAFDHIDTPEYDVADPVRETRDPMRYFEIVAGHTCRNPPPTDFAALVFPFGSIGAAPCAAPPENEGIRAAIADGARTAQQLLDGLASSGPIRNGWRVPDPNTGQASLDYAGRAVVQLTQIGSFMPLEAMYFVGRMDGHGRALDGRQSYTLTFPSGELPPVDPRAFWSLTMYRASDNLLVHNTIGRYALRPTTPGLMVEPDGSLTLHIGSTKPANAPEGNWLPAPAEPFVVVLRTYLPADRVRDGEWFPPAVVMNTVD